MEETLGQNLAKEINNFASTAFAFLIELGNPPYMNLIFYNPASYFLC